MAGMSFPAPPGMGYGPMTPPAPVLLPGGPMAPAGPSRGPLAQIDELAVPFAYDRITQEVRRRKGMMIMRIVSFGITAAILIGLQIWRNAKNVDSQIFGWPYFLALGISLGVSLGFLGYAIFRWVRARQRAQALRPGPVVIIARPGVELSGEQVPWSRISALQARSQFSGDTFLVHRTDEPPLEVAFDLLDIAPSSLDSAARAFSGGRVGVDFAKMDN